MVAIMFLARGGMPMTKVWEAWLQPLQDLIPIKVRCMLGWFCQCLGVSWEKVVLSDCSIETEMIHSINFSTDNNVSFSCLVAHSSAMTWLMISSTHPIP